jgi:hypothetical protein
MQLTLWDGMMRILGLASVLRLGLPPHFGRPNVQQVLAACSRTGLNHILCRMYVCMFVCMYVRKYVRT